MPPINVELNLIASATTQGLLKQLEVLKGTTLNVNLNFQGINQLNQIATSLGNIEKLIGNINTSGIKLNTGMAVKEVSELNSLLQQTKQATNLINQEGKQFARGIGQQSNQLIKEIISNQKIAQSKQLSSIFTNPNVQQQLAFGALGGGLPGLVGGIAGAAAGAGGGPQAAAGAALIGSQVFVRLAEALMSVANAGLVFEKSILGISSILQLSTKLTGPGGKPLSFSDQLEFQQQQATKIQLAARQKLLPIGIAGQQEATFVQGITSALAQRGINPTPELVSTLSSRIGAIIVSQRRQLLENPTQLLRDVQDIVSGGPMAKKTILSSLLGGTITSGFVQGKTGEDLLKTTKSLDVVGASVTQSKQVATNLLQLSGAIDNFVTKMGTSFIDQFSESFKDLATVLSDPTLIKAATTVGSILGKLFSFIIDGTAQFINGLERIADFVKFLIKKIMSLIPDNVRKFIFGEAPKEITNVTVSSSPEAEVTQLKGKYEQLSKEEQFRKHTMEAITPQGRYAETSIEIGITTEKIANLTEQIKKSGDAVDELTVLQLKSLQADRDELQIKLQLISIEEQLAYIDQGTIAGRREAIDLQLREQTLQGKISPGVANNMRIRGIRANDLEQESYYRSDFNESNPMGRMAGSQYLYTLAQRREGLARTDIATGRGDEESARRSLIQALRDEDFATKDYWHSLLQVKEENEQWRDAQLNYIHTIQDGTLQFNNLNRSVEASQDALDEFKDNLEATFQTEEEKALNLAQQIKAGGGDIPDYLDISPEELKAKHLESQQSQLDAMLKGFGLGGADIEDSGISFIDRDIDPDFAQGRFQRSLGRQQGADEDAITKSNYELERFPTALQHAKEALDNFTLNFAISRSGPAMFGGFAPPWKGSGTSLPQWNAPIGPVTNAPASSYAPGGIFGDSIPGYRGFSLSSKYPQSYTREFQEQLYGPGGLFGDSIPNLNGGVNSMTDQVQKKVAPLTSPQGIVPAPTSGQPRDQHSHTDRIVTAVENLRSQMPSLVATGVSQGNQASFG